MSENKGLAHPASVDSIPPSAGKEDHVSMGATAAHKAAAVVANTARVLAVELIAAAEALEFRRPLRSSAALEAVHALLRTHVPAREQDRILGPGAAGHGRVHRVVEVLGLAQGRAPLHHQELPGPVARVPPEDEVVEPVTGEVAPLGHVVPADAVAGK